MSNDLIPVGDFIHGFNFEYNFTETDLGNNTSSGNISASHTGGNNYDLYIHNTDNNTNDNNSHLNEIKSNIKYIYISNNNSSDLLLDALYSTTSTNVYKFTCTLNKFIFSLINQCA